MSMRNQQQDPAVVHPHPPEKKANPHQDRDHYHNHDHPQGDVRPADTKDEGDNNIRREVRPQDQQESTAASLAISLGTKSDRGGDSTGDILVDVAMDGASPGDSPAATSSLPPQLSPRSTSSPSSSAQGTTQKCVHASAGMAENRGSVGLDMWHKWVARQSDRGHTALGQINAQSVLEYLDSIIIPMEISASDQHSVAPPSPTVASVPTKKSSSLIQTHVKPIIQLWQQQQLEAEARRRQDDHFDHSKTSSFTLSSLVTPLYANRATATQRQQDHVQRLIQLEKSHRDTALVISQLQEQVQRLSGNSDGNGIPLTQPVKHWRQGWSHESDGGTDQPPSSRDLCHVSGAEDHGQRQNHAVKHVEDTEMKSPPQQPRPNHPFQHGNYHSDGNNHADDLIAIIAKGLEEYHARLSYGHHAPRHRPQQLDSWGHSEDYGPENPLQLPQPYSSPSIAAAVLRSRDSVLLDRTHPGAVAHSDLVAYEAYPHLSQRHAGFQQDDFLLQGHHTREVRSLKRSSSVNGPGTLFRENTKHARSCSPPRPRTSSGATAVEVCIAATSSHSSGEGIPLHTQSQPPASSPAPAVSLHHVNSPTNKLASAKESSSAAPIHFGGTEAMSAQSGYHMAHARCPSRGQKYSHASQLSRSMPYTDDEYLPYHQHHEQQQEDNHAAYQFSEGVEIVAAHNPSIVAGLHYAPHFKSETNMLPYRGRDHAKSQGSFSSQYSSSQQHQYQRNDSRAYQGYDQQHRYQQQAQLTNGYMDQQEEDVKPPHHHQQQQAQQKQQHHGRQDAPPPIYVMNRQVNTVPELWKEWTVGLGPENPSIRQLETQYGPSWRTSSSAANFFSRRLRIINEIQRMIDFEGLGEDEAVNRLEARREQGVVVPGTEGVTGADGQPAQSGGMSLHRLSEILRKKQL